MIRLFYRAQLWASPCCDTSLLGAAGKSLPHRVCKQKLARLAVGLSHIAAGDLAMERNLEKSWELAFDLVQLQSDLVCLKDKEYYCKYRVKS